MAWGKPVVQVPTIIKPRGTKKKLVPREDIVTLDFETYYDQDFTLRKLSTSEYIRDPRFEVIMCGVKVGTGPTIVHDAKTLKVKLARLDWSKLDLLCHNTPFDGFILSHHYGVIPRKYLDTLSMARGLHGNDIRGGLEEVSIFYGGKGKIKGTLEKVVGLHTQQIRYHEQGRKETKLWEDMKDYCARDIDECHRIFYEMMDGLPEPELDKIDLFVRMFCQPRLLVDRPRVQKELVREIEEKERKILLAVGTVPEQTKLILLLGRQEALAHAKKEISSSPKFAEILKSMGVVPPMKPSPAALTHGFHEKIFAFSQTDEEFLALLEHPDKCVRDAVEARLAVKSTGNEAKAARFLKASEGNLPLPVMVQYYGAHTGRPSGGNKMNMLNLERGGELRKSLLAPKGQQVVVADSGQIEARFAMWVAGQDDALEDFRLADQGLDRDPYCKFADDVYGYTVTKDKHPQERFVGKVSKLSLQYQAGPPRFQTMLALGALGGAPMFLEIEECQRIVYLFRRKHDKVVKAWEKCNDIIKDMVRGREGEWGCLQWERERIWLPNGMCLKYPGVQENRHETGVDWHYLRKGNPSKIYGGLLFENIVQALANVLITEQMLEVAKRWPIVTMTYDELVALAPTKQAKKCYEDILKVMATPSDWCKDMPLIAEGGFAQNYSK